MTLTTRQQYENEINRLQNAINNAQKDYDYHYFDKMIKTRSDKLTQGKYGLACKGGGDKCWEEIRQNEIRWNNMQQGLINKIENAKSALWNYQKQIAQEEQDAQVKAVKQAIAEQVKAEQEKIIAQNQNTVIETPTIKNPIAQIQQEVIQPQANNQNLILPLAVVAGVLLL